SPRSTKSAWQGLCQLHPEDRPDIPKKVVMLFVESSPLVLEHLQEAAVRDDAGMLRLDTHVLFPPVLPLERCRHQLAARNWKLLPWESVPDALARVRANRASFTTKQKPRSEPGAP